MPDVETLDDLTGEHYQDTLRRLHHELAVETYLKIGTLYGETLRLSAARSVAIDPALKINGDVIGAKPSCHLPQMASDEFFAAHDPKTYLTKTIDLAFLDGMHRCEFLFRDYFNTEAHCAPDSVIALHDCIPTEIPMTDRDQDAVVHVRPHRAGWWTGDVWRTVLVLKRHRPDLTILCLDCWPTGLVLITGLDPTSTVLRDRCDDLVQEMMALDLATMTLEGLHRQLGVISSRDVAAQGLRATVAKARGKILEPA